MFDSELYLEWVRVAIDNRPVSPTDKWVILWSKGVVSVWPAKSMYVAEFCIWVLTKDQAEKGLTAKEWTTIAARIHKLVKNMETEPLTTNSVTTNPGQL